MPCQDLFDSQSNSYKQKILNETKIKISIHHADAFLRSRYGPALSDVAARQVRLSLLHLPFPLFLSADLLRRVCFNRHKRDRRRAQPGESNGAGALPAPGDNRY